MVYPELAKLAAQKEHISLIRDFLSFAAREHDYSLAREITTNIEGYPLYELADAIEVEQYIQEYLGIDWFKCETERQSMIRELQA